MKYLLFILIGMVIGIIVGEKKICEEVKGSYNFDYGTCNMEGENVSRSSKI